MKIFTSPMAPHEHVDIVYILTSNFSFIIIACLESRMRKNLQETFLDAIYTPRHSAFLNNRKVSSSNIEEEPQKSFLSKPDDFKIPLHNVLQIVHIYIFSSAFAAGWKNSILPTFTLVSPISFNIVY